MSTTNDPMFSNNEEETPMSGMNEMMGKKVNTMGGSRRRPRRSRKSRKSKRSRTARKSRRR